MLYRIFIIYLIIVILYFRITNIEHNKIEKMVFSIFIPFFGLIVVIISGIIKEPKDMKIATQTQNKHTQKLAKFPTDIQSSLIDNLAIGDFSTSREIILSAKSLSLEEQCKIYHIAINSKNLDISHISAISLMRIQNYFEKFFRVYSKRDLSKIENLKKYVNTINQYLNCNILYGNLKNEYTELLINSIKVLIKKDEDCEEKYYHILIQKLIDTSKYEETEIYIKELILKYNVNAKIYELLFKLYIKTKNKDSIYAILNNLKEEENIKKELQPLIEFWS